MIHVHCLHVGMLPIEQQHEVGGEEDSQSTTRMPMHTPTQISIRMRATWANLLISNQESLVQQVQTHTHTHKYFLQQISFMLRTLTKTNVGTHYLLNPCVILWKKLLCLRCTHTQKLSRHTSNIHTLDIRVAQIDFLGARVG